MKCHVKPEKGGAEMLQLNQRATDSLLQEELVLSLKQVMNLEAEKALQVSMLCPVWVGPRCIVLGANLRRTAADECAAFPAPGQKI